MEKRKVGRPKKTSTIVQEPKPGSAAAQHTYMLSTIYTQLNYVMEHLANIEYHASSITMEDVSASVNVLQRIMHNKFGNKSHQEEI